MGHSIFSYLLSVLLLASTAALGAGDFYDYIGKKQGNSVVITAVDLEDGDQGILLAKVWGSTDSYQSMADRTCELVGYDFASSYKTRSVRAKKTEKDLKLKEMSWALDPSGRTGVYSGESVVPVWENYTMFTEVVCEGRGPSGKKDTHQNSDGTVTVYSHKQKPMFFVRSTYLDLEDAQKSDLGLGTVSRHASYICEIKVGPGFKAKRIAKMKTGYKGIDAYELVRGKGGSPRFEESYRSDSYNMFSKIVCSE